jgi:hypothetical protein
MRSAGNMSILLVSIPYIPIVVPLMTHVMLSTFDIYVFITITWSISLLVDSFLKVSSAQ